MNKLESILTDAEMHVLISGNPFTLGLSIARLKVFIVQVEKAVVAKLVAEQEPVAVVASDFQLMYRGGAAISEIEGLKVGMMLYAHPVASVSESAESEDQDIELLKQALETMIRAAHPAYVQDDLLREKLIKARDIAFKALKTNRLNTKERHRTAKNSLEQEVLCIVRMLEAKEWADHVGKTDLGKRLERVISALINEIYEAKNHIPDASKMVPDMYWINPDYPSTTSILDAFDPVVASVEVNVGDKYEVSRAKTLSSVTVEVTELTEYGDVKAYKVLSGDHIPNAGKMITPLTQRKIQSVVDKDGYRVIENATVLVNERGHAAIVNHGGAFYWVENKALAREYDGTLIDEGTITTKLSLSVDTKEVQALIKSYLEGLDDWQLVPIEPTDSMRKAGVDLALNVSIGRFYTWDDYMRGIYNNMLAAAPKYTGGSDD